MEFHNPQIFWFPLFKKSYLRFCHQIYTKFYIFHHQAMLALWGKRTSGTGLKVALFITIGVLNTPMHMSLFSIRPRHGWSHRIVNPKIEIFAIDGEKRTCVMDIYTALKREEYYLVLKQTCSFLILHQCHISQSFQANRPHGIACFNDIIKIKHLQKRRTVKVLAGNYLFGDLQKSHPFYW